jgi:hypothetical protein
MVSAIEHLAKAGLSLQFAGYPYDADPKLGSLMIEPSRLLKFEAGDSVERI